jgi:hypothetical protein
MRTALVAVLAVLVLAPAALADTTSTDSPRDPTLPPSGMLGVCWNPAICAWKSAHWVAPVYSRA